MDKEAHIISGAVFYQKLCSVTLKHTNIVSWRRNFNNQRVPRNQNLVARDPSSGIWSELQLRLLWFLYINL